MSSDYNTEESQDNAGGGQDQTEGGTGEGGGEENNEADMIFAPEASKPGRNAGMLMVAFVMIGVGVIYFMRVRGGPAKVAASADVVNAERLIDDFTKNPNKVKDMKNLLNSTAKLVEAANDRKVSDPTLTDEKFNPFAYVSPNGEKPKVQGPKGVPQAELDRQRFIEDVGNLKVQYIMVSSTMKSAMIDNKLIKEGQEVNGMVVEKITPTAVTVSRGKLRAEVKQLK